MTAAIAASPFRFFDLRVKRTTRLGPSLMRVTFGGPELADVTCGGRDQRVKLFFPHPHQELPVMPADRDADWFGRWRAMDPTVLMRSYTIREHRPETAELDIDFALHGTGGGPASRWASGAEVGSPVVFLGPVVADNGGVDFRPPADTDWVLLTADETALPAVEAILSWVPARMGVRVWIEVAGPDDIRGLPTRARAEITWLVRETSSRTGATLAALRRAQLPSGTPYVWLAGESAEVRVLRRHLVNERGFARDAVVFTGYWRRGAGEDDLLAEHFDNSSDQG
jgi:NADPH-dependent ferric siderophore reductase